MASNGWPVWFYEFDVGENGGLTRHAYEIGFIFARQPVGGGVLMQDYWAALALTGDPNGKTAIGQARPRWERWDPKRPRQMAFGAERKPHDRRGSRAPRLPLHRQVLSRRGLPRAENPRNTTTRCSRYPSTRRSVPNDSRR